MSDASSTIEILLHFAEKEYTHARHSEDQRAGITGLVVLIASAIQGGLTQTGFTSTALPLTIMLIIIGAFGIIATAKLYERFSYHSTHAREIIGQLNKLCPDTEILSLYQIAKEKHSKRFPILSSKVRISVLWLLLHFLIVLLGILYTAIILMR